MEILYVLNTALGIVALGMIALFIVLYLVNSLLEWIERKNAKPVVYRSLRETLEYMPQISYQENEEALNLMYKRVDNGYVRIN